MKKNLLSVFVLVFLFCSCSSLSFFSCPYQLYEGKVSFLEDSENIFLNFSFLNDSEKSVESFTISFSLCSSDDSETSFLDSSEKCELGILPHEERDFEIDITERIRESWGEENFSEALRVENLYVRSIRYSNGSFWTDPYGMYGN